MPLDAAPSVGILHRALMCPHCGRDAPIVYRGLVPSCTACGAPRGVLSGPSVNLAGQPARVGGTLASVAGFLVLGLGGALSLGVGLLLYAIATSTVALAFALPLALLTVVLGVGLLAGGRSLRRSGVSQARDTLETAFVALVAERGAVTAAEAARAAGISLAEADSVLTSLVKRDPERVKLDVDDQGVLWFRGQNAGPAARVRFSDKLRVDDQSLDESQAELEAEASQRATFRK